VNAGAVSTTASVVLTPFPAGPAPWPNERQSRVNSPGELALVLTVVLGRAVTGLWG
jgi:hypothetical protein